MATDTSRLTESPGDLRRLPNGGARYYDAEQVVTHLNYALHPTGWDWTVLDYGIDVEADEVWALGQLTARMLVATDDGDVWRQTVKTERGYQSIGRKRDGSVISMGDSYKGAASDSLKRCARLLGVGLDAWAKDAAARQPASGPSRQRPAVPVTDTELVRAAAMVTGAGGSRSSPPIVATAERAVLLTRYEGLLAEARDLGFTASWTNDDPERMSDIQAEKYADLLAAFVARQRPAAAGAA